MGWLLPSAHTSIAPNFNSLCASSSSFLRVPDFILLATLKLYLPLVCARFSWGMEASLVVNPNQDFGPGDSKFKVGLLALAVASVMVCRSSSMVFECVKCVEHSTANASLLSGRRNALSRSSRVVRFTL